MLTSEIVADIINGASKADVFEKLQGGIYQYQERALALPTCYSWWNKAIERLKFSNEQDVSEHRAILWNRYEQLYHEALETGQIMTAKSILDSMGKTFGLQDAERKEVAIIDGKIEFGFEGEETEE